MLTRTRAFIALTKPRIMLLVVAAGITGLILEGSLLGDPVRFLLFVIGLYLTGGCANALNQVFERDIDSTMARTRSRRPLPLKQLSTLSALAFSIAIGAAGVVLLAVAFNLLTAFLALGTILFYSLVYTLWLKPTTSQNIVIGGVAGAMAPVGAWTAATGSPALTSWLLFAIIFFWTPPHFWSLALKYREDYRRVELPMLPVTHGISRTLDWMLAYSVILFLVGLLPVLVDFGWLYLSVTVSLGLILIKKVYDARKRRDINTVWGVFRFSPVYLFGVFLALIADRLVGAL